MVSLILGVLFNGGLGLRGSLWIWQRGNEREKMMKVEYYCCYRCGTIFHKDIKEKASVLTLEDHDVERDESLKYDLCSDCVVAFYSWQKHHADYDKFSRSMQKTWEKEKEK
jgi:hypothetical protein